AVEVVEGRALAAGVGESVGVAAAAIGQGVLAEVARHPAHAGVVEILGGVAAADDGQGVRPDLLDVWRLGDGCAAAGVAVGVVAGAVAPLARLAPGRAEAAGGQVAAAQQEAAVGGPHLGAAGGAVAGVRVGDAGRAAGDGGDDFGRLVVDRH